MLRILKKSFSNGILTTTYPSQPHTPPVGFRGKPQPDFTKGTIAEFQASAQVCPTAAITYEEPEKRWKIDYGKCIFCGRCEEVCTGITLTGEFELASRTKADLVIEAVFKG